MSSKPLLTVQWSPDGKSLATLAMDKAVYSLDAQTGKHRLRWRFLREVTAAQFSPDWKQLATRSADGRVRLWNTARRKWVQTLGGTKFGDEIQWSPDGSRLAITTSESYRSVLPDSSGKMPVTVNEGCRIQIYDVPRGKLVRTLRHRWFVGVVQGHGDSTFDVAWSPDGRQIATAVDSPDVDSSPLQVWDVATGQWTHKPDYRKDGGDRAPAWRPDGKRIATPGSTVIDPAAARVVRRILARKWPNHRPVWYAEKVAWSPDGQYLAERNANDYWGYDDKLNTTPIRVWRVSTGHPIAELRQRGERLEGLAWSPDGRRLACAAGDGTLRIWDLGTSR